MNVGKFQLCIVQPSRGWCWQFLEVGEKGQQVSKKTWKGSLMPARARILARNDLVKKVEFLALITQK